LIERAAVRALPTIAIAIIDNPSYTTAANQQSLIVTAVAYKNNNNHD
jgi:hypothetical protein